MIVKDNNGTALPIWKKYLEGIFNISNVKLDFDKDKILVSDPDLVYMSLLAAYLSKASPILVELYVWIKVKLEQINYIIIDLSYFLLFLYN